LISGYSLVSNYGYFDGYLAEYYLIDGQALSPSSFGETDAITGRWKARAYGGTYGNNGFYLSFKDNTSTTTLGYDDAGSNDWTLNNFSVTAGTGNDSLVDSPTNYGTDTGVGGNVRGNYCTLSAIDVFYKNGTSQGTAFTDIAGSQWTAFIQGEGVVNCNFGQRTFAYAAPTGFKTLCTQNLPQPTIQKPNKYMDALTYTGTGASNAISSLGFSPDLVWIKNRGTTTDHALYDTTRGTQAQISSNSTAVEVTSSSGLTAFDSAGFTIGTSSLVNTSGTQYVAWSWDAGSTTSTNTSGSIASTVRANQQTGFSVVSFTATGANSTVGHGLGVSPKMIITKPRNNANDWYVYHEGSGANKYLVLNSTTGAITDNLIWQNTSPTSSVFYIGSGGFPNNWTEIAYCFSEIEGYSKFGSYTGNGSADGPFVWCGFRPRFFLWKRYNTTGAWNILDTARDTFNLSGKALFPHLSNAEFSGSVMDINSNGVKLRDSSADNNASGGTYIFAAFAESPFKYARAR